MYVCVFLNKLLNYKDNYFENYNRELQKIPSLDPHNKSFKHIAIMDRAIKRIDSIIQNMLEY